MPGKRITGFARMDKEKVKQLGSIGGKKSAGRNLTEDGRKKGGINRWKKDYVRQDTKRFISTLPRSEDTGESNE
jgi:hypothetical protein